VAVPRSKKQFRTQPCHAGGCGFESRRSRHFDFESRRHLGPRFPKSAAPFADERPVPLSILPLVSRMILSQKGVTSRWERQARGTAHRLKAAKTRGEELDMTLTNVTDQGFSTNLPTKNSKDDLRRVCQNIVTIARDMRREWLDREHYELGAVQLVSSVLLHSSRSRYPQSRSCILGQILLSHAQQSGLNKSKRKNLANFGEATTTPYDGGQPSKEGFRILAKMGINIVIDLRGSRDSERKIVTHFGMQYVALPWHCSFPKDKIFAQFSTG
jgi:hypothetical protein